MLSVEDPLDRRSRSKSASLRALRRPVLVFAIGVAGGCVGIGVLFAANAVGLEPLALSVLEVFASNIVGPPPTDSGAWMLHCEEVTTGFDGEVCGATPNLLAGPQAGRAARWSGRAKFHLFVKDALCLGLDDGAKILVWIGIDEGEQSTDDA
jgi:hypothetical protein